ncbi:hypothetical protein PITC_053760 [Penicillium italicum]|uniref:Uncharacterized protein n=1 Tax=Penicillium italicum TaxID=40296 RepID=A0A0A2KMF9_PENIT|nr:hypothetical protein PITC_053760 [Penicillium italicum]
MQSSDKPSHSEIGLALPTEKTQDEIRIEASGDINALQRYRRSAVYRAEYCSINRAVELLRVEQDLRDILQEEQWLTKKPDSTSSWPLYRNDVQAQLQALNKRYWLLEREWWKVRNLFVEGPLIRGFDLWRSHPLWYMHRVLFEDCVRRGGCCSRRCGCCVNRSLNGTRRLGAGHCTLTCGCCHQSRGFELTEGEETKIFQDFHVVDDNTFYRMRINRVSIWGLSLDSHDSPFDLIVMPPGYDSDMSKEQTREDKANQVDEPFVLIDEEHEGEVIL